LNSQQRGRPKKTSPKKQKFVSLLYLQNARTASTLIPIRLCARMQLIVFEISLAVPLMGAE